MKFESEDTPVELIELKRKEKYLEAINSFATVLFEAQSIDEIVWAVTQNAIAKLGYHDCVIYLYDDDKKKLIQRAAYGPKNPSKHEIFAPIELEPGTGIAGSVFSSGIGEIINDTTKDPRYLVDDEMRYSEISIPLIHNGESIGVLDSEHPEKGFFTEQDFKLLTTIAAMTTTKIAQAKATEELQTHGDNLRKLVAEKTAELESTNAMLVQQNQEKELLLKEIHHRVKNNLQIIISLVNLQMDTIENEKEKTALGEFRERIRSMALIHEQLYREKDMSTISINEYILELVQSILMSFGKRQNTELVDNIEELFLDLDTSIPLGLIFNELVTNSIKHAFGDGKHPRIEITLKREGKVALVEYTDNGDGFQWTDESSESFGLNLIEILVNQIGSGLKFENTGGLRCSFSVNL